MEILSFDNGIKPKEHYEFEFDPTHVCLNCGIKFGHDYIVNIEVIGKDSSNGSDPLELVLDSQTKCPKCGDSSRYMGGNVFLCDNMMADTILILNKAGYKTDACCAGHCYSIDNNRFYTGIPYILFAKEGISSLIYDFAWKRNKNWLFDIEEYLKGERAIYSPSANANNISEYREFVNKYNGKLFLIDDKGYTTIKVNQDYFISSSDQDPISRKYTAYSAIFETQEDAIKYLKAWNREVEELIREFCK